MMSMDLNCDMGELPEAIADGTQESLLRSITSANVACGGHAGDERTMRTTIEQAMRAGVAVGAHPGYPDRENFGRLELKMSSLKHARKWMLLCVRRVKEQRWKPMCMVYSQSCSKSSDDFISVQAMGKTCWHILLRFLFSRERLPTS